MGDLKQVLKEAAVTSPDEREAKCGHQYTVVIILEFLGMSYIIEE